MPIILWNRTEQNCVTVGGRVRVFADEAAADVWLARPQTQRLSESPEPPPQFDKIKVK